MIDSLKTDLQEESLLDARDRAKTATQEMFRLMLENKSPEEKEKLLSAAPALRNITAQQAEYLNNTQET